MAIIMYNNVNNVKLNNHLEDSKVFVAFTEPNA